MPGFHHYDDLRYTPYRQIRRVAPRGNLRAGLGLAPGLAEPSPTLVSWCHTGATLGAGLGFALCHRYSAFAKCPYRGEGLLSDSTAPAHTQASHLPAYSEHEHE